MPVPRHDVGSGRPPWAPSSGGCKGPTNLNWFRDHRVTATQSESMMTQSVDRPKELLFEREAETLAALARRVEALNLETRDRHDELIQLIEDLETRDHAAREAIEQRLASLIARTGDDEVLTRSVADVLDRAFSEAERHRHDQLANAVSPVIVRTVRTEITNSRDEIAEALYPVTGQMVKAYVASAMRDLVNQINHRLENNALMLRIKSLTA